MPASLSLVVTQRCLARRESFTSPMYNLWISKEAITILVPEVCEAIVKKLNDFVEVCMVIDKLNPFKLSYI